MIKTESYVGTWTDVSTAVSVPEGGGPAMVAAWGFLLLLIWVLSKR